MSASHILWSYSIEELNLSMIGSMFPTKRPPQSLLPYKSVKFNSNLKSYDCNISQAQKKKENKSAAIVIQVPTHWQLSASHCTHPIWFTVLFTIFLLIILPNTEKRLFGNIHVHTDAFSCSDQYPQLPEGETYLRQVIFDSFIVKARYKVNGKKTRMRDKNICEILQWINCNIHTPWWLTWTLTHVCGELCLKHKRVTCVLLSLHLELVNHYTVLSNVSVFADINT